MMSTFPAVPRLAIRPPAACALVLAALMLAGCSKPADKPAPKVAQVGVVTVALQRQTVTTELTGRTRARLVAEIRPQVGGIVQQRLFEEGSLVKAGQVLYQLEPSTFQAAANSARAGVAKAQAAVDAARATAARNAELVKIDAISRQAEEDSQAALSQARAELAVAQAALENAKLTLGFTRIVSPIAGRVETSTVTPGALVTANQTTALTTVQQIDPLYVDVTQSTTDLLRLRRELAAGTLKKASGADEAPIRVLLEDGTAYPHAGRLQFSGTTVNPATGAVTLRALVPNPDRLLLPGMYVRAVLEAGVVEQAVLVPQQAVTRSADGSASVLVVDAENKLRKRKVAVGRAFGNRWQVESGLAAGERVVMEGSQKAKVGDVVQPVPAGAASAPAAASASASSASASASSASAGN
jgi:membrane fusion protein (multidrug efflux system)